MRLKAYAVKDTKTETFGPPIMQRTHGEAERTFTSEANNKQSRIGLYPTDHELYYLGEYDDQTGKFELEDSPKHMLHAGNLVQAGLTQVTQ